MYFTEENPTFSDCIIFQKEYKIGQLFRRERKKELRNGLLNY